MLTSALHRQQVGMFEVNGMIILIAGSKVDQRQGLIPPRVVQVAKDFEIVEFQLLQRDEAWPGKSN